VFTADQEVVTISMDGIVERFAPQQSGHCIGLIEESDSNKMIHTHHPEGVISLNELGELKFFALGTGSAQQSSRAEVTAIPGVTVWKSSSRLNSLVMSDDRETIAVTDDAGDLHILSHWRDDAGRLLTPSVRTFHTPQSDAARTTGLMAVSATSRYVATSSNTRQIVVYDLARDSDEPIVRRWYENIQACIAFSPDEQSLFIGGFAGIDLVDLATGQSRFCVPDEDRVRRVAFSPLGTQLIVGLKDGSLTCLDQQTGAPLFRFHGIDVSGDHADLVASIGFISEDRLLTVGSESELHFWDLNERLQLGSFEVRQADDSRAWCRYLGISPADNELVIGLDCKSFAEVHRWRW
jgi:WD40 repeat protein